MRLQRSVALFFSLALVPTPLAANDLTKVDRTIVKEPIYQSKSPRYGLLVFGPNASERVWLVADGDTLYVDRNGNGDLTEPGAKIATKIDKQRDPAEYGYSFEVGDLQVGGKVHKNLVVSFVPLATYAQNPSLAKYAALHAALKADPKAAMAFVGVEVESPRLKGGGAGGRLYFLVGSFEDRGPLQFAARPADAPIIHFDGPLQIAFFMDGQRTRLRLGRPQELVLMVGTPGRGPGSFAMLAYEDTIPEKTHPQVDIVWPGARKGDPPVAEKYELKERC